ncbi:MAG: hypothetical protein RMJ51_01520 [Candidatus Calescibacterium sp.]|nr:hypothetical protein [Candidatus Calescibacterium sp.]MCX7971795.1 hypothetical protein [bacterium]MDW8194908.1 hypothetical protein [Candidatus Calescibacterium sp.]
MKQFSDLQDLLVKVRELLGEDLYYLFLHDVSILVVDRGSIKTLGGCYKEKKIFVYDFRLDTFFHELGHHVFKHPKFSRFFHFRYLWDAFYNYQKQEASFLGHQAKCSLEEFFCQIFAIFFTDHEWLWSYDRKLYIELYKAIEEIIKTYRRGMEKNL